jgi:hypothetical protein
MDSPLLKISQWLREYEEEIQSELLNLCYLFHYDINIRSEHNPTEKLAKIFQYLDSPDVAPNDVITRTLFMTQLFDFAFEGRDTEEGWDKSMDLNLDARNRMVERGEPGEFIDNSLKDWQERKYFWINMAKSWSNLKDQYLSLSELNNWWFNNLRL